MAGFVVNIEKDTLSNNNFRKVIFTAKNSQLVLMSLLPGEEIGMEVHTLDQFIRFEAGEAKVIMDGKESAVGKDWAIVIPAGTHHNVINTSKKEKLKLYSIYSPPNHPEGTIHKNKAEAEAAEHAHAH